MKVDYWKMMEYSSINEELDCTQAKAVTAGIDVGAVSTKAVILVDGKPYAVSIVRTRQPQESALRAINTSLSETNLKLENIHYIVSTGIGRTLVPYAQKTISEIACCAAGAAYLWGPSVRTVLDAGGETCKVIHCTGKGRVTAFLWNDKCSDGIGRSLEVFANLVRKDVTDIGNMGLQSDRPPIISDFCAVYARSEALDLIRMGAPPDHIVASYHYAMAKRIATLVSRLGVKKDFVIVGGLAKNKGIKYWLESILKVNSLPLKLDWDPALTTALGAALFAKALHTHKKV